MNGIVKYINSKIETILLSNYVYYTPKPPKMKTKLLKRIRKQYSYYINDKDEYVVIDHYSKTVCVMSMFYFESKYPASTEKDIVDYLSGKGARFAELKKYLLSRYGYDSEIKLYRKANRFYKRYTKQWQSTKNG